MITCAAMSGPFQGVVDAFRRNFDEGLETGAAMCVYSGGTPVVDVWGGVADTATNRAWKRDTAQIVFSTTKGITAICVLSLVERGLLALDRPLVAYWPELGTNGKHAITLRMVLSHRAGLPFVDAPLPLEAVLEGGAVLRSLEAQTPVWPPDTQHGYHGHTYGWLLGEVVRRVTGASLGSYLRSELAAPLGAELWIGLPEAEEGRVATLVPPVLDTSAPPALVNDAFVRMLTVNGVFAGGGDSYPWNTRELRAAEMPAVNGFCTARGLARLYAATLGEVDGIRALRSETVEAARKEHSGGRDALIGADTRFGLGFLLTCSNVPWPGENAFGSAGAGGSFAFADPDTGIAMAYVCNRMGVSMFLDPRALRLIEAVSAVAR